MQLSSELLSDPGVSCKSNELLPGVKVDVPIWQHESESWIIIYRGLST